ncbi:unnamed protein product [Caenorhabditis auriculariae]|uniref:Uncharacterized protein n=1 Tax=Caenorhabditis auriculariae TaxID=2777116 RepID=A0A8S1HNG4_9PELO|nr:unnamed protein product [Caenorhabditis auriculariae]
MQWQVLFSLEAVATPTIFPQRLTESVTFRDACFDFHCPGFGGYSIEKPFMKLTLCDSFSILPASDLRIAEFITFGITFPLNILAFYCIAFKSPPNMLQQYKYLLFNCQIWTFCRRYVGLCFRCPGFFYVPAWGGYFIGLFQTMGMPPNVQIGLMVFVSPCLITSMISLFEHRHFCVTPRVSCFRFSKRKRYLFLIISFLLTCLPLYALLLLMPKDQMEAKESIIQLLGCIPEEIFTNSSFVFDLTNRTIWLVVPLLFLTTPFFSTLILFIFNLPMRALATLETFSIGLHGMMATMILLLMTKSYRTFCFEIICKLFCISYKRNIKKSSVVLNSPHFRIVSPQEFKF